MQITVKFFASLRETTGCAEECLTLNEEISIGELWQRLATANQCEPTPVMMAINQTYVTPNTLIQPNDEVAFFPPVTGG